MKNNFFYNTILKFVDENEIQIKINDDQSNFDIFDSLVSAGVEERKIIELFENETDLKYVDIMEEDISSKEIGQEQTLKLIENNCAPIYKDGKLCVVISEPAQKDIVGSTLGNTEYELLFCFDFLITTKINSIGDDFSNLSKDEKSLVQVDSDKPTVILATGQSEIDQIISTSKLFTDKYNFIATAEKREDLYGLCYENKADIIIVGDNLGGKTALSNILLQIKNFFPDTRIIYLAGEVDSRDTVRLYALSALATIGIYDIVTEPEISVNTISHLLANPMTQKDVLPLLNNAKDSKVGKVSGIKFETATGSEYDSNSNIYENVYTFASGKGGTGKSLVLQSVAIAISDSGILNTKGKKPRIGIIDLDTQGFTTSTFFKTLNTAYNLFSVIDSIKRVVGINGEKLDVSTIEMKRIIENIHFSFVQASGYKNIFVLGGSGIEYQKADAEAMNQYYLTYLIEAIVEDFDIILIDTPVDFECKITKPLMSISKNVYNVIDANMFSFNSETRRIKYLQNEQMYIPMNNKFVLNKSAINKKSILSLEDIEKGLNIKFDYLIPKISDEILFNASCRNTSFMRITDESLKAGKIAMMLLANDIYPIKGIEGLLKDVTTSASKQEEQTKDSTEENTSEQEGVLGKLDKLIANFANKLKSKK